MIRRGDSHGPGRPFTGQASLGSAASANRRMRRTNYHKSGSMYPTELSEARQLLIKGLSIINTAKLVGSSTAVHMKMNGFAKAEANDQVRQHGQISGSPFFWVSASFFSESTDRIEPFAYRP